MSLYLVVQSTLSVSLVMHGVSFWLMALLCSAQRLLKMVDGLNFKDFVAFLSAFNARASMQQKSERKLFGPTKLSIL